MRDEAIQPQSKASAVMSTFPQIGISRGNPHPVTPLLKDTFNGCGRVQMSLGTIVLIILIIALLGGFSGIGGGPFYGTGYYGGGGLGLVIVVLLILLLLGKL